MIATVPGGPARYLAEIRRTFRRAGRMHHLGVGYTHRGQPTIVLIDAVHATVVHRTTGEVLSTHNIEPARIYWPNTQQKPGRWPGSQR